MGMTYFKRYRMEYDLNGVDSALDEILDRSVPAGYEFLPYSQGLLRDHSEAKFQSFRHEMDADVFPCLGKKDGCHRLMREICSRQSFIPQATWLCEHYNRADQTREPVGTIQGLSIDDWGAIQNIGIHPLHRNRGLGGILLARAAEGFRRAGLSRMHLEVTTDNTAAIRFYERVGFRQSEVVYKAAEVVGA